MRVARVGKDYEVLDGFTSMGYFSSLESATEFVNANGGFSEPEPSLRRGNGSKYGGAIASGQVSEANLSRQILEEAYEVYFGNAYYYQQR